MVSTWKKATSSVCTTKDVVTQMENQKKLAMVQISGCGECQSLVLLLKGSRERRSVRCDDLLSLVDT